MHFWSFGAEDVVSASLASSPCHAFVAALIELMFGGHRWEFRTKESKFLIRFSLGALSISISPNFNVAKKLWIHILVYNSSRT